MRFMISISFETAEMAEVANLIPDEQAHVKELLHQKVIETIYISADRTRVWMVMAGESETDIQALLKGFPLYPYMQAQTILLV